MRRPFATTLGDTFRRSVAVAVIAIWDSCLADCALSNGGRINRYKMQVAV